MSQGPVLVWFRLDLRVADNPALHAAAEAGGAIVPVFIFSPEEEEPWAPGGASRWWLHHSLRSLQEQLHALGSDLVIRRGSARESLCQLVRETGAQAVFWNRRYEPAVVTRDVKLKEALREQGVAVQSYNAALLHEPWTIQNQSGKPFQVFTPFWRHCLSKADPNRPIAAPSRLPRPAHWPASLSLASLELLPKVDWAGGLAASWRPGESGAEMHLKRFLAEAFDNYAEDRDRPAQLGTSRLSPHLHFGEISPRQIWAAVEKRAAKSELKNWRTSRFLTELGWREFAHHLLFHFPRTPDEPLRAKFGQFNWRENPSGLRAWQRGETGYPIVDTGMRELWATGWMHNRVRMIVASFLVKDLLISWREGARWFWDTLVDADLSNNTLGWQWTAGCGADAAPFFRIFNPSLQGQKFDPDGEYVRRWCSELSKIPRRWIHQPWQAPASVLREAGVELGHSYPERVVKHDLARVTALELFAQLPRE